MCGLPCVCTYITCIADIITIIIILRTLYQVHLNYYSSSIEVGIKCWIMSTFKALMMSALNTTDQHNLYIDYYCLQCISQLGPENASETITTWNYFWSFSGTWECIRSNLRESKMQKFSGGACPQTPLDVVCLRTRIFTPLPPLTLIKLYFAPPWVIS